jgi:hypothetical protein
VCDGKPARGPTRIFIDSARKRYRKEVLANCNKTRINTGHKYDLLVELKQAMKVQTHAQV